MTEEIIIDGVNVRGCEYYKGKCMEYTHYCQIGCKECTDIGTKLCHYKQTEKFKAKIARLEQENKELKDKITALEDKLQLRMASDKESDEYWDEIFSAEDYPFNKENAYKELKDYYFVLEQIPKIYMEITGGTLSKTTYFASSVIQAYNDALERYYDKIDDLEYNNNAYRSALEEIKEKIKSLNKDICNNCGWHNTDNCQPNGYVCHDLIEIKNKIDEVLPEGKINE